MASGNNAATSGKAKKSLILNAFVEMCKWNRAPPVELQHSLKRTTGSGHQSPGLWQHPQDRSHEFNDIDHWIKLAQLLESSKFHGMFIADVLGMSLKPSLSDIVNVSGPVPWLTWFRQAVTMCITDPATWMLPSAQPLSGPWTNHWRLSRLWLPQRRTSGSVSLSQLPMSCLTT